jgi:hypothetical protein
MPSRPDNCASSSGVPLHYERHPAGVEADLAWSVKEASTVKQDRQAPSQGRG